MTSYKKAELLKSFERNLVDGLIKESVKEGLILGYNHPVEFWNKTIEICGKHINIDNVQLPSYIIKKYEQSEMIGMDNGEKLNLLIDVICVVGLSNKNKKIVIPKIKQEDYEMMAIKRRMKTTNLNHSMQYFVGNENSEIKLAINEIIWIVMTKEGTFSDVVYWMEWLRKIEKKFSKDWTSIIWNFLGTQQNEIVNAIAQLYRIGYKKTERGKRFCLIYFAFMVLMMKVADGDLVNENVNYIRIQMCMNSENYYGLVKHLICGEKNEVKVKSGEVGFNNFVDKYINEDIDEEDEIVEEKIVVKKKKSIKETKLEKEREKQMEYQTKFDQIDSILFGIR